MNNQKKLLKYVFEEPHREFHIRLLARLTRLNPNTVISISDKLAREGIIEKHRKKDTNLVIIKANAQNALYKLRKQFYNIEKIYKSGLVDYLNKVLVHPTIMLFGSYAKAENRPESDIDLFIITEEKKDVDVGRYEKILNAEIQIFIHTKQEFENFKKNSPELINNVINGYKLSGFLETL